MVNTFPITIAETTQQEDVVNWYMFHSSISKQIQNKRWRTRITVPLTILVLSVLMLYNEETFLSLIYLLFGIGWYFFLPRFEHNSYRKYFNRWIAENIRQSYPLRIKLTFDVNDFRYQEEGYEEKVSYTYIDQLYITKTYFFIYAKNGRAFVFNRLSNPSAEQMESCIEYLKTVKQVPYKEDLLWRWR